MKPGFFCSVICGWWLVVVSAPAIEPAFDTLIPYPRELAAAGEPVALQGFTILVAASKEARIGAGEINQRIESLGGKALPIAALAREGDLPEGNLIILATGEEVVALPGKAVPPHEQGYLIRPEKRVDGSLRLWLVGSDPLGTLYAAVTARQLIQSADNSIALRPATISDWPDFKKRQLGHPMSEPRRGLWYAMRQFESEGKTDQARKAAAQWVARKKTHYDWMLRAKINWAWSHSFFKLNKLTKNTGILRAAVKEVNDYGLERGIRTMVSGTTSVGEFPADKDNPDFKDVAFHNSHHRYFCWSRLDYHHEKAKHVAQMMADCGYKGYYLHAADGGGWRNPGLWNDRCAKCRETYGDDHAKADSVVFGIYYDAIRKQVPDCDFAAVVYPYSPEQLDADLVYQDAATEMGPGEATRAVAEKRTQELVEFIHRLDALLPPDIFVTVREAERPAMDKMRAVWGKRRFHTYYEYAFWKGWQPYFTTTPLWTKSFYYPGYDDMLYGSMSGYGWREAMELLGAECAWNVNRPGAKDFSEAAWKELGTRLSPPLERTQFASRASRFWFGGRMGPLISPVFAENISLAFIADPGKILERTDIDDPLATMAGQAEATRRAAESLDKAREIQQAELILKGEDLGFFLNMVLMTHGAAITAEHRARMMRVQAAIDQGDREQCARLLSEAETSLASAALAWQKIYASVDKKQLMLHYTKRRNPYGYVSYLDISEFEKEVDELASHYEQLITARTMPAWFLKSLDRRRVKVGRTKETMKIDGRMDENAWNGAQPLSNFIRQDRLQLETRETRARLLFDPSHLYVAFQCLDPGEGEQVIVAAMAHRGAKEKRQWTVGRDGKVSPASSGAIAKTSTGGGAWMVEMAIPLSELGFTVKAGSSCAMQFVRRSKVETVSYGFTHGEDPAAAKHFVLAEFTDKAEWATPAQLGLDLDEPNFRHETIGTGAGTVISGELSLLCDRPLHQVQVTVRASDGVRPLGEHTFSQQAREPLIWRPGSRFVMRFPEEVPGVVAHFKVTAKEGEWEFSRRFGSPRRPESVPADLFTSGVDAGGKALNLPIHFPSVGPEETPWPEGTIEFWLQPKWRSEPRREGPRGTLEHALVHMGPIRPDHPTLNNLNALALVHTSTGYLSASIASSRYRSRSTSADVRHWKPGEWHHVAMQWKRVDPDQGGGTTIQIYIDGKLASGATRAAPKETAAEPLVRSKFRPPIQIGSMNTGVRPAAAAIDELRISSLRRYSGDFQPAKRVAKDDETLVLFHFDGNLDAEGSKPVKATVGAAQ